MFEFRLTAPLQVQSHITPLAATCGKVFETPAYAVIWLELSGMLVT